jgi:hypothetical protein
MRSRANPHLYASSVHVEPLKSGEHLNITHHLQPYRIGVNMTDFANRYVSVQLEPSTYGTGSGATLYGEVDDESLQARFDIIERGDMNYWAMQKSKNGKEYSEGDLNFVFQSDDFVGMLLYGAMGDDSISTLTHTMSESINSALPSFTIKCGREEKASVYTGMMVNRMSLSANVGEYVTASFSFTGKMESALAALSVPNWTAVINKSGAAAVDGYHFASCDVKFDADAQASTFVKSMSLELNNNLDTDNSCSIGDTTYSRAPIMQRREVTGTLEFNQPVLTSAIPSGEQSEPNYDELITSGGHEVIDTTYAIQFTFSNGTSAQDCVVTLYDVRYEAPTANVSGRDTETMSVNFRAYINPAVPSSGMIKVVFKSSNAGNSGTAYSAL